MQDSTSGQVHRPFGKYTLIAKLASGGMGEIYLARLEGVAGFEKIVVIKRVLPHLAGRQAYTDMLLDEARIAARLSHPNICQVHELGETEGEFYIAMEYLEGISVSDLLRRAAKERRLIDPRLVVAVISQSCEGLHAAHELADRDGKPTNLVHRDVSPSNLFITTAGAVKILDFGIAKTPDKLATTRTGTIKGKWAYMSPEQILGQTLDRRSDIFSLGIVLFEALTTRRLYARATEYLTCQAITEFDAPSVRRYRPELPEALARIVAKMLSRRRDARYPSARDVSKALTASVASLGGPVSFSEIAESIGEDFRDELAERRAFIQQVNAPDRGVAIGDKMPQLPTAPASPTDTSLASAIDEFIVSEDVATRTSHVGGPSAAAPEPLSGLEVAIEMSDEEEDDPTNRLSAESAPAALSSPDVTDRAGVPLDVILSPPPRSRKHIWAILVLFLVGAGAAGAYFLMKSQSDRSPAPAVVVYQGKVTGDDGGGGAAPADAGAVATATTPDASAAAKPDGRKPKDRNGRRKKPKNDSSRYGRAVGKHVGAMVNCFEKHTESVSGSPKFKLKLHIEKNGKVSSVKLSPSSVASTPAGGCVIGVVRKISFGTHDEAVDVTIPLTLKTRHR